MNDKSKREKVAGMHTEAIERILGSLSGPEAQAPSPEYPLGGQVYLSGIGYVTVKMLREELASRKATV